MKSYTVVFPGTLYMSLRLYMSYQNPSHLKTLVPNQGPGALIPQLVHDGVGKVKSEGLLVHDGAHRVAAQGIVAASLRLVEGPGAANVLKEAVGRGVGKGHPCHTQHR